jgi:hypothetical protein
LFDFSTIHSDVILDRYGTIVKRPARPAVIDEHHPEQVMLLAIVDDEVSPPFAFRRIERDWRIELDDHAIISLNGAYLALRNLECQLFCFLFRLDDAGGIGHQWARLFILDAL